MSLDLRAFLAQVRRCARKRRNSQTCQWIRLVSGLGPAFAAGFAVQRLLNSQPSSSQGLLLLPTTLRLYCRASLPAGRTVRATTP
jgi:hypothetical protein